MFPSSLQSKKRDFHISMMKCRIWNTSKLLSSMLTYHQDSEYILKSPLSSEHNQTGQIHVLYQLPLCQQKIKPLSMKQTHSPKLKKCQVIRPLFLLTVAIPSGKPVLYRLLGDWSAWLRLAGILPEKSPLPLSYPKLRDLSRRTRHGHWLHWPWWSWPLAPGRHALLASPPPDQQYQPPPGSRSGGTGQSFGFQGEGHHCKGHSYPPRETVQHNLKHNSPFNNYIYKHNKVKEYKYFMCLPVKLRQKNNSMFPLLI